ncbi:hypothetical protein LUZ60_010927 [Juncus effusus]|nr:hypothetical protein LUZ60_010927 [Juncus effusus]
MKIRVLNEGYVCNTSFALHDMDEEQKEESLWNHSEKITLAYGLIRAPKGSVIRVFKNLRVCGDCHLVFKFVSRVFKREILLRDPYRFHSFKSPPLEKPKRTKNKDLNTKLLHKNNH